MRVTLDNFLYTPSDEWQILSSIYYEWSCYEGACDLPKVVGYKLGAKTFTHNSGRHEGRGELL